MGRVAVDGARAGVPGGGRRRLRARRHERRRRRPPPPRPPREKRSCPPWSRLTPKAPTISYLRSSCACFACSRLGRCRFSRTATSRSSVRMLSIGFNFRQISSVSISSNALQFAKHVQEREFDFCRIPRDCEARPPQAVAELEICDGGILPNS